MEPITYAKIEKLALTDPVIRHCMHAARQVNLSREQELILMVTSMHTQNQSLFKQLREAITKSDRTIGLIRGLGNE